MTPVKALLNAYWIIGSSNSIGILNSFNDKMDGYNLSSDHESEFEINANYVYILSFNSIFVT